MALNGSVNYKSPTQCFTAPDLFKDSIQLCNPYISALQTCPIAQSSPILRSQATNLTALCMMSVWAWDDDPLYLSNYTSTPAPNIQANTSCQYPDMIPILQQACAFEYNQIDVPCYNNENNLTLRTPALQYTLCQTEAMLQYWRCTEQKPFDEVASCVIENADKVNWVPPIEPYSGAPKCPDRIIYLVTLGVSMILNLVGSIVSTWLVPPWWKKLMSCFKKNKRPEEMDEDPMIWDREYSYTIRAHLLLKSIGTEFLGAYLTVLILQRSGVAAIESTKVAFIDALFIFVVKPRVAPLTGLFGLFHGFSEAGLADVFADNIISWVAGSKILINYWKYHSTAPANPAAPANDLKILSFGAIMSSMPAILAFLFLLAVSKNIAGERAGTTHFILVVTVCLLFVMIFICFLPILAIIEMCAMVVFAIRHKMRGERVVGKRELSQWEKPLTTESRVFSSTIYPILVLISFVINIGNWIFFVQYLKIAGDTFCPGDSTAVQVLWLLLPQAINLAFLGFKKLTGQ